MSACDILGGRDKILTRVLDCFLDFEPIAREMGIDYVKTTEDISKVPYSCLMNFLFAANVQMGRIFDEPNANEAKVFLSSQAGCSGAIACGGEMSEEVGSAVLLHTLALEEITLQDTEDDQLELEGLRARYLSARGE